MNLSIFIMYCGILMMLCIIVWILAGITREIRILRGSIDNARRRSEVS